jgi:hypothetical protein
MSVFEFAEDVNERLDRIEAVLRAASLHAPDCSVMKSFRGDISPFRVVGCDCWVGALTDRPTGG